MHYAEAYSEPCQSSKMEFFLRKQLTASTILDVWQGSEYASAMIITQILVDFLRCIELVLR